MQHLVQSTSANDPEPASEELALSGQQQDTKGLYPKPPTLEKGT
jgi:hypothetical protein